MTGLETAPANPHETAGVQRNARGARQGPDRSGQTPHVPSWEDVLKRNNVERL
jgi:hypothetical protein